MWANNLAAAFGVGLNTQKGVSDPGGLQFQISPALTDTHYVVISREGSDPVRVPYQIEMGTSYQFEWIVKSNCQTEARVWKASEQKPTLPTISSSAFVLPPRTNPLFLVGSFGGSGCCTYPGYDVRIDNIMVTTFIEPPEDSGLVIGSKFRPFEFSSKFGWRSPFSASLVRIVTDFGAYGRKCENSRKTKSFSYMGNVPFDMHVGIDLGATRIRENVYAMADGRIVQIADWKKRGKAIYLEHRVSGTGAVVTFVYAQVSLAKNLRSDDAHAQWEEGDLVRKGEVLGRLIDLPNRKGVKGTSDGDYLHLSMMEGQSLNVRSTSPSAVNSLGRCSPTGYPRDRQQDPLRWMSSVAGRRPASLDRGIVRYQDSTDIESWVLSWSKADKRFTRAKVVDDSAVPCLIRRGYANWGAISGPHFLEQASEQASVLVTSQQ